MQQKWWSVPAAGGLPMSGLVRVAEDGIDDGVDFVGCRGHRAQQRWEGRGRVDYHRYQAPSIMLRQGLPRPKPICPRSLLEKKHQANLIFRFQVFVHAGNDVVAGRDLPSIKTTGASMPFPQKVAAAPTSGLSTLR